VERNTAKKRTPREDTGRGGGKALSSNEGLPRCIPNRGVRLVQARRKRPLFTRRERGQKKESDLQHCYPRRVGPFNTAWCASKGQRGRPRWKKKTSMGREDPTIALINSREAQNVNEIWEKGHIKGKSSFSTVQIYRKKISIHQIDLRAQGKKIDAVRRGGEQTLLLRSNAFQLRPRPKKTDFGKNSAKRRE